MATLGAKRRREMIRLCFGLSMAVVIAMLTASPRAQEQKTATFAGGCFWCVESDFDKVPGVIETISGYTGGILPNPTYEQVTAGGTGHLEAVQIVYDPSQVSYAELLTAFWHSVDPTDGGGQFCDRGQSYQTAIFVADDEERRLAVASKEAAEESLGKTIVTPVEAAAPFFPAEDHHQDFYEKSPLRYRYYRYACGRDQRVKELWGDRAYQGIPGHS